MKLTILPEDVAKANELLVAPEPKLLHCERCIVGCAITRQTGKIVPVGYGTIGGIITDVELVIPDALVDKMLSWDRRYTDGMDSVGEWELVELPYSDEVDI